MDEIFTRGWDNLLNRIGGPMTFRVVLQPAVAIMIAIRSGLRDARTGRPPFLWAVFTNPGHRRELVLEGWKEVAAVFIVALILDSIYQVIVHSGIYPVELLVAATILVLVPYLLVRGPVTRIARWRTRMTPTDDARGNTA
jgi:hypothetical protein